MTGQLIRPQTRQHTVSRVVLKRFTRTSKISVFDRERDAIYSKGPGGVFCEPFDQFDPASAEERWGRVESRMTAVFKLLDSRSALGDPAAIDTLRDLVALHWVRSPARRLAHERIASDVVAESVRQVAGRPDILSSALRQRTGLVAAGAGELNWINERVHREAMGEFGEQAFSDGVARHFEAAREILGRWHVQLGYADARSDFLIGDAPVVTMKHGHDGVGPHQGVALGDASLVVMPISPRILVAMGPEPGEQDLSAADVDQFNALQARGFVRWIGCRPGGPSDMAMRREVRARSVYP